MTIGNTAASSANERSRSITDNERARALGFRQSRDSSAFVRYHGVAQRHATALAKPDARFPLQACSGILVQIATLPGPWLRK